MRGMYLPLQSTRVTGVDLAFRSMGTTGSDVLFVHGWVSSGRMWHSAMRTLSRYHRTFAPDLPGFGDSQAIPLIQYKIDFWVDLLAEFIQQQGLKAPMLVGHSMGGMISIKLALRYPELVSRIVCINPVVTGRTHLDLRLIAESPLSAVMRKFGHWVWPFVSSGAMADPLGLVRTANGDYVRNQEDWGKVNGEMTIAGLRAIMRCDLSPQLPQLTQPTLVVIGRYDLTAPNSEGRLLAEKAPNAELVVLRAGHLPTDDLPSLIEAMLLGYAEGQNLFPQKR